MKFFFPFTLILALGMAACAGSKAGQARELSFAPGPHALVYKAKAKYQDRVPIVLSADGSRIVSYPAPQDLKRGGELMTPLPLTKGYYLDRRGIGPQVAFTHYTYAEYAALPQAPSHEQLMAAIVDRSPLKDLCDCGLLSQFEDPEQELNQLIKEDRLEPCKPLLR